MTPTQPSALRAARHARGWSLTDTAQQLVALGATHGVPVATARSLRSQLSRWENGHATPEPSYRALLAELLAQPEGVLGIAPPIREAAQTSADRLRAALAEAAAIDRSGVDRWREQLTALGRLDDELGTAAAADLTCVLVERLEHLLGHTVEQLARSGIAEILSDASALAGVHALDRGAPDVAWRHYERARGAAQSPRALSTATCGLVEVLVEIGRSEVALTLLTDSDTGAKRGTTRPDPVAVRLAAAKAFAAAAAGRASVALAALAEIAAAGPQQAFPDGPVIDRMYPNDSSIELSDLHRWRGRALALLGGEATDDLRRALGANPSAVRHRAEVLADLAAALAADATEEAAACAREARDLALRIGAPRITARLAS